MLGTRSHHLALYVVYENPLPMVSDYPEAYEGKPGFDFIRQVPVRWDETKVVAGAVGQYIAIARRHGADWYIGTITDWTSRELHLPLSFLGQGNYTADIFSDSPDSPEDPNRVVIATRPVTSRTVLIANLERGGGQAVRIRPVQ